MPAPNITGTQILNGLNHGYWAGGAGLVLTYSVPGAGAAWGDYGGPNNQEPFDPAYHVLNDTQAASFAAAMELYDSLLGATFNPVSDSTPGAIRIAFTHMTNDGTWGYAYLTEPGTSASDTGIAGDVWLNTTNVASDNPLAIGTYDWQALMHEIGHALGLKHPFDESNHLPAEYDNYRYTIMSYTAQTDAWRVDVTSGGGSVTANYVGVYAITPMMFDIYTLQNLYGADANTRSGNTTYTFDASQANLQTIYDAGGTDTWDLSTHTRASFIDLTPAAFSSVDYYPHQAQIDDNVALYGEGLRSFFESVFNDPTVFEWSNNVAIAYNTIIENVWLGSGNDSVIGNDASNALIGNGGNDTLSGGNGNDVLAGGAGLDSLDGGAGSGDTLDYSASGAAVTVNLATNAVSGGDAQGDIVVNFENVTGSIFADTLTGDAGANILSGGNGADTLNGGAGADTLIGSTGNDVFIVDNGGDVVTEGVGAGTDTIRSSVGIGALAANVENLEMQGSAITANGNELNNRITGNGAANNINGGLGVDTMLGGLGNDTYFVDNVGDVVNEASGEGTDTIFSTINIALLATNVENLSLNGVDAVTATGNSLNNVITGNSTNNVLNGGAGEDTLNGGLGNDSYIVNSAGDVVSDTGGNADTITSFIDMATLTANIENLTLAGTALIGGGNGLNNVIVGNSLGNTLSGGLGNDQLNGATGADTMSGGAGDDSYLVENAGDVVIENSGEGSDTMYAFITISALAANVEKLNLMPAGGAINGTANELDNRLNGNDFDNVLTALGGADVIQGLGGNDHIIGGAGLDNIFGGTGNDVFVYQSTSDSGVTGSTRDLINDFTQSQDQIDLSAIDAISGGGDDAFSFIGTGAFTHVAGQLRFEFIDPAGTANDYTIISMDVTGDGIADSQIALRSIITLTGADFVL
ncbi:MAG: M10 family metallopeptidase [Pseudomonadota bacterium]